MMEQIKKNLLFVIGLIVLLGGGVFWYFLRDTGEGLVDTGIIEQPTQFAASRAEILGTIAALQAIRLDITVLDDPAFRSLTEASQPPETPFAVSKRNPFVP